MVMQNAGRVVGSSTEREGSCGPGPGGGGKGRGLRRTHKRGRRNSSQGRSLEESGLQGGPASLGWRFLLQRAVVLTFFLLMDPEQLEQCSVHTRTPINIC